MEARSNGQEAWFTGDVMHHPLQIVDPDRNSQFCAHLEQARATLRGLLESAADRDVTLSPAHFARPYATRLRTTPKGFEPDFVTSWSED